MKIIVIIFAVIIILLLIAIGIVLLFKKGYIRGGKNSNNRTDSSKYEQKHTREFLKDFDEIKNNTIICDNGTKLIRGVKVKGICVPLQTLESLYRIEDGYVNYLNSLDFLIMQHIQADKINLDENIKDYQERARYYEKKVKEIEKKYKKCNDIEEKEKLKIQLLRNIRTLEYAYNLVNLITAKCENEYILNRHYYILFKCENENETLTLQEKLKYADSELEPIISSTISALKNITGGVSKLTSEDLAEMLYRAYNPEQSGFYKLRRALRNGYFKLYITAKSAELRFKEAKLQEFKAQLERSSAQ